MSAPPDPPAGAAPIHADLLRDWTEIWTSELAAMARDRETAELMARLLAVWAGALATFLPPVAAGGSHDASAHAGTAPAPGAAPAAAAPGAGESVAAQSVAERIARLEARIAELERDAGRKGGGTGRRAGAGKARGRPNGGMGGPARGGPAS